MAARTATERHRQRVREEGEALSLQNAIHAARTGRTSSIRCTAHEDKSPSLSILPPKTDGWVRLKCHKGCNRDEILRADGLNLKALAPDRPFQPNRSLHRSQRHRASLPIETPPSIDTDKVAQRKLWPSMLVPDAKVLRQISTVRGLATEGLELAVERGVLRIGHHKNLPCWFVTDDRRTAAQARRIDGQRFFSTDGPKGLSLTGTVGGWPIGAAAIQPQHRSVMFCEGGPDLLAAHCIIAAEGRSHDTAAVALLGAAQRIAENALPIFAGRRIRIFEHSDKAGNSAVKTWAQQLESVGSDTDFIRFDGLRRFDEKPVKDLNDFCLLHADDFETYRWTWEVVP